MNNIAIYACGGCGTNVAKQLKDLDFTTYYIDTSTSNLKGIKADTVHILENVDGAGKDRSKTYHHFKDEAQDLIVRFKPSPVLNVIISSLSGGSGSIIGPLIAKELAAKGENVIVIGIDSRHSVLELSNTIKTLQTYKAISDGIKKAIGLFYIENTNRKETDDRAIQFITLLGLLVNKTHTEEFDTTDLANFINFNKVTDNPAVVGVIDISPNEIITPEKDTTVVASILLTANKSSTIHPVIPEYLATCIITDPQYGNEDIRIDNILGKLTLIVENLEREIVTHMDAKRINRHKELTVEGGNSDCVIL